MDRRGQHPPPKGRGALSNRPSRFAATEAVAVDDGWGSLEEAPRAALTELRADHARHAITYNRSPDIPFDRSINSYQGCEHGCVYCYARPSHSYWSLGAGLDFETRIIHKPNLVQLLERELRAPGYVCQPINLGANTDPYQPVERELRSTRAVLESLLAHRHPVTLLTKGTLILRDLDLLAELAERRLASVLVSLTTLDDELKRRMEPRAAAPAARLRVIESLARAGVPVGVLHAPVIPARNDHELERLVEAAAGAGASHVGHVLLRLPNELEALFREWLAAHYPERAARVMNLLCDMRGGRANDPRFGARMRGTGPYAELIERRVAAAARRHGLEYTRSRGPRLDTSQFLPDPGAPRQASLF
jgi:DNA repair photolyase